MENMPRSLVTVDLAAIRHNARTLLGLLGGAELWAVVKADGYGHGAAAAGRAALEAGATTLCVATLGEALELREALPVARLIVLGPIAAKDVAKAREAGLELCVSSGDVPEGVVVHLKLDTGMGRWGLSELAAPGSGVVGLMSHFASADSDPVFTQTQLERFLAATAPHAHLTRHIANSAGTLRHPAAYLDAVRCGIALFGISPFGTDPAVDGLRPALAWVSSVALVKTLAPGQSTGYGRHFVAQQPTRIGIVPVGYADGFRRDMTGSEVVVAGERARVIGSVSMDALAVVLPDTAREGDIVTLIGDGVRIEEHAGVSGTISYEIACGIGSRAARSDREVIDE
jgi:alanine racemase